MYTILDVFHGLVVDREDTVLSACLNGHVADSETVVHGQLCNTLAGKFHRLVQRTVYTDLADDV